MRIAITGSTGFIGQRLVSALELRGDEVTPIGRPQLSGGARQLAASLADCDAIINLAGAPVNKRWSVAYKAQMRSSRIETTQQIVQAMALLERPPACFISTSAIGAYAAQGHYTEADSANADDFLGQLCKDWEAAAREAETLGVRTLIFRLALVLGSRGGLMKQLLPPFRLGLGGPVGDGAQHFSWIHIDDLISAYLQALDHPQWTGVYHLCAPNPVSNLDFTRNLGAILHRPTPFRVPSLLLKLAFGEGAEVMTSGQAVTSVRLPESGFRFRYPDLNDALVNIVEQPDGVCPMTRLNNA